MVLLLHQLPKEKVPGGREMRLGSINYKLICPHCSAAVITANPEMLIWELCPSCRRYVWDMNDVLMADVYAPEKSRAVPFERHA